MSDESTQTEGADTATVKRAKRQVGRVVSAKAHKTIVVTVERRVRHPKFKKIVRRHTKLYAHDEENTAQEGDTVVVEFTRPLSKLKRWRLIEVVK